MNIQESLEKKGLSFIEYTKFLNMSYIFATVSENYHMQADDLLRKGGEYRLENKQLFNSFKNASKKLLIKAENLDEKYDDTFYSAVDFIKKLMDICAEKELSDDDQIKIISYIKNNYQ